jgi:AcrR family transcriptional regulator
MTTPRPRMSPGDYVTLVLDLAAQGHVPADLSLEELLRHMQAARGITVTRGSFYYHFASMDSLHQAVLARWREATSDDAIETALRDSAMRVVHDPGERLLLLRAWSRATAARDQAIRRWAERPGAAATAAAAAVAEADAAIIAYARQALRDLGYGRDDAQVLALLLTRAFTGDDITDEGFARLLGILRRAARQRPAQVGVAAGTGGGMVLYETGDDADGRGQAAQKFAAEHEPGTQARPARPRARRATTPGG